MIVYYSESCLDVYAACMLSIIISVQLILLADITGKLKDDMDNMKI